MHSRHSLRLIWHNRSEQETCVHKEDSNRCPLYAHGHPREDLFGGINAIWRIVKNAFMM